MSKKKSIDDKFIFKMCKKLNFFNYFLKKKPFNNLKNK